MQDAQRDDSQMHRPILAHCRRRGGQRILVQRIADMRADAGTGCLDRPARNGVDSPHRFIPGQRRDEGRAKTTARAEDDRVQLCAKALQSHAWPHMVQCRIVNNES